MDRPRLVFPALLVVLVSLFLVTGFRGLDLGMHWDEVPFHIQPSRAMVGNGIFLPHEYTYPSLSKWLVLLAAWPAAVAAAFSSHGDPALIQAAMKATVDAPGFLLAARGVFLVMSALSIVWTYGAVWVLRRKGSLALFAACGMGLSWEYAYHARWVANDCILTMFAAMLLFLLSLFHRNKQQRWLYLAAVAAGLGTGAKPLGLFLLIPVFFASVVDERRDTWRRQLGRLAALGAIAFAAFIVTTPGVLLEPFTFIKDGRNISAIYAKGHGGFTTASALQHWGQVLTYLSVSYFSPFKVVSLGMFACAAYGGVIWVKRDWRYGLMLLSFPATFLTFFCAKYNVMLARNYLTLAPLLCVMAARGLEEIYVHLKPRWARVGLAAGLGVLALVQAGWLIQAAESIRHIDPNQQVRQAINYVAAHPGKQFRVSDKVRKVAADQNIPMPANVTGPPGGEAVVMFGRGDIGPPDVYQENDPWLTEAVFGPREVNFNWYAVWSGHDRVVVMPIEKARESQIPFAK